MNEVSAGEPRAVRIERLDLHDGSRQCIEWIGDVVGTATRFIKVDVSRWSALGYLRSRNKQTQTIEVPVSFLSELRLGDVWKDGILQGSELLETEMFPALQINESTATVNVIGKPISRDEGKPVKYAVPFSQYSAFSNHKSSFIARVRVNETTFLVVPSIEIIRFYFAHYGSFTKLMFSGSLDRAALRKGCTLGRENGTANVVLPAGVHSVAAPAIARIAFDDAAGKAYSQFVKSGTLASMTSSNWYPKMGFPLAGLTNLQASGRWIEHEGERTFIVFKLLSCSHPLPFRDLYYHRVEEMLRPSDSPILASRSRRTPRDAPDRPFNLTTQPIGKGGRVPVLVPRQLHNLPAFPDLEEKELKRGNDRPLRISRSELLEVASASLGGVRGRDALEAELTPQPIKAADAMPDLLGYQVMVLAEIGCRSLPFKDGQPARRIQTDALPTTTISTYDVWLAFFGRGETEESGNAVLGLACLHAPLGNDLPELAVMRLAPAENAQMASEAITCLRQTLWRISEVDVQILPGCIDAVFTKAEIEAEIQQNRIDTLLKESVARIFGS